VRNLEMGSATVPVAVFGVAPKTLQPTHLSNDGSGATPEPARGTHALPPIVHTKMKTGKEPFKSGIRSAVVAPSLWLEGIGAQRRHYTFRLRVCPIRRYGGYVFFFSSRKTIGA
jgi:hypothetical protein